MGHEYLETKLSRPALQRIQDMDQCGSMGVVLGEEAQREGCHWVVTPRPVQFHKQLTTLLGN